MVDTTDAPAERISFTRTGRPVIYPPEELREPSAADAAFAAGLYEGEGTIHHAKPNSPWFGLIIPQGWAEPLLRIQEWAGGTIYFEVDPRRRRQMRRLHLRTETAVQFALTVGPWLSPRRRDAIASAMAAGLRIPPR